MISRELFRLWLRHERIAFDTSFLIPLLEDFKEEGNPVSRLVRLTEKKSITLVTSTVTLLEILVHPYRRQDAGAIADYYGYLNRLPLVRLLPVTSQVADRAAALRARYGFKTPDAIQLATALTEEATLFLTRDREFRKQKEIAIGVL